jgi:hypothetical protein
MAVLNPPRVFPGLGRAIVNFLLENRSSWDEDRLVDAFKPQGVNEDVSAPEAVRNTISALRAIGILTHDSQGNTTVANSVSEQRLQFDRGAFRRLLLGHVLDLSRDGDPWSVAEGEAASYGARDLTRALSWFLAQDALGVPLRWADSIQNLQFAQFGTNDHSEWAIVNVWRSGPFERWTEALGLGVPSVVRAKGGLVPLPTLAIADAVAEMPDKRMTIHEFLGALSLKLPVLHGGTVRSSLVARLGLDPDPGVQGNAVDTSVAQALRSLEGRGRLEFESLADADGVYLSRSNEKRTTHVVLKKGMK